ncbi:nucleotide pyrophosphatase/phosphodiesterase family protein [Nocardioides sp. NPDC000445]|uniref:alkaline phosphatase family protein n=1 Tax=Nocardioides sp. NPDC000445 TaxID=3154257 RepID=UPI00332CA240
MTGFLAPAYGERSLGDVLPAVAAAMDVPLGTSEARSGLELPSAAAYVVFLVDGMGTNLLRRYAHAAPFLASLSENQKDGTAGVPSTTATSLTSFGTGLTPGGHGLVGYTSRIPGTEHLLNALQWRKDIDPVEWQPNQTVFQRLSEAGVPVTVINKRVFGGSGLTIAAHRGAEFVGADRVGERIASAVALSRVPGSLTYLYDGDLDWTGHKYGVASSPWLQQLSMIDAEAEQLRDALDPSVRLLVLADHGMVDSPATSRTDIDDFPELRHGVALVGGEARFRHLYCSRGAVDDVVATWSETLGEKADVMTRETAIRRGWFGPVTPAVLPRLGDVIVASHGEHAVVSTSLFQYETTLVGLHGSLTPDEMLIPLLVS